MARGQNVEVCSAEVRTYDVKLNEHVHSEVAARGFEATPTFDWMAHLRAQVRLAGFRSAAEDEVVANLYTGLFFFPGELWKYEADRGTKIEQRFFTLVESRLKDIWRNQTRAYRRLPTQSVNGEEFDFEICDTTPDGLSALEVSESENYIEEFRKFLAIQRNGKRVLEFFEYRWNERDDPDFDDDMTLDDLESELKFHLGIFCQNRKFRGFHRVLKKLLRTKKKPVSIKRDTSRLRICVAGTRPEEVTVIRLGRLAEGGKVRVRCVDGEEKWVDTRDLLRVVPDKMRCISGHARE